jgi:hypothetical protein
MYNAKDEYFILIQSIEEPMFGKSYYKIVIRLTFRRATDRKLQGEPAPGRESIR